MSQILNCGFVRSLVLSGTTTHHSHDPYDKIYDEYLARFDGMADFESDRKTMKNRFKKYAKFIRDKKVNQAIKDDVKKTFSSEAWNNLSRIDKDKHTLSNCQVKS